MGWIVQRKIIKFYEIFEIFTIRFLKFSLKSFLQLQIIIIAWHTVCHTVPVASLSALGPWAPPAERGPSLESIYRVSLTVDLCEGNKIISLKKLFYHSQLGHLKKKKNPGPWARVIHILPRCHDIMILLGTRAFQFGQKKFLFDSIRFSLPNRFFRFYSIRQSDKFAACTLIFK